jgi:hypothetical protein
MAPAEGLRIVGVCERERERVSVSSDEDVNVGSRDSAPQPRNTHRDRKDSRPSAHPFFMNREQREAQKKRALQTVLDTHIAASNALNRSIQSRIANVPADAAVSFFDCRKRAATASVATEKRQQPLLARCGLDMAPFPAAFQVPLTVHAVSLHGAADASAVPLPELQAAERDTRTAGAHFRMSEAFGQCYSRPLTGGAQYAAALRDLVTAEFGRRLVEERAVVFLLIGPSGCGKTQLAHDLALAHKHTVIELNTLGVRSGRSFEPVLTALAHQSSGTVGSRSRFFQKTQTQTQQEQEPGRFLVLVDEVDVVFEEERGFWSGLNVFLAASRPKTPVIITANSPVGYLAERLGLRFPETAMVFEWPVGAIDWRREGLQSHVVRLSHSLDTTFDCAYLGLQDERIRWYGGEGKDEGKGKGKGESAALEQCLGRRIMAEALRTGFIPRQVPVTAGDDADLSLDKLQGYLEALSWLDGVEGRDVQGMDPLFVWESVPFANFPDVAGTVPASAEYAEAQLSRVFVPFAATGVFLADPKPFIAVARQLARRFQSSFGGGVWRAEAAWTVIVVEGEYAGNGRDLERRMCVSRFKRRHRPFYRCLPDELVDAVLSL